MHMATDAPCQLSGFPEWVISRHSADHRAMSAIAGSCRVDQLSVSRELPHIKGADRLPTTAAIPS